MEVVSLLLLLVLSSSVEAPFVGAVAGNGADGNADGRLVGRVGACSCCENPTSDTRTQKRPPTKTDLALPLPSGEYFWSALILDHPTIQYRHELTPECSPHFLHWFDIKLAHLNHNRSHNGLNRQNDSILLLASRKDPDQADERAGHNPYSIAIV